MTEDAGDDGGFISRWSARKRRQSSQKKDTRDTQVSHALELHETYDRADQDKSQCTAESVLQTLADNSDFSSTLLTDDEQHVVDDVEPDPRGGSEEAPLLTDEDMPPVESLTADSDISAFFNRGVSAVLRRAALRHVFHQPVFNVRDGLNDYDGDYTVFEPLGDTITSDMKWHSARKERERLEALAREEAQREQERLDKEKHKALEEGSDEPGTTHAGDQGADDQGAIDQGADAQESGTRESDVPESVGLKMDSQKLVDLRSAVSNLDVQESDEQKSDNQRQRRQSLAETGIVQKASIASMDTDVQLSDRCSGAEKIERDKTSNE